jgi:acyl dehydratase
MPRFSEVEVGQQLPVISHEVTQEVIDRNAVASLDYNPVHTNIPWCKRAKVFGTELPVGHGMFTMSAMASVVTRWAYAEGAQMRAMDAKFFKPVPAGDRLTCTGVVKELHPVGPGRNFVVVSLVAQNRNEEPVAMATASVQLPD